MKYIDLIFVKTWADIKSEASRAYIGFLWWIVEPLLYMGAFYLLFGLGLRMGGDDFLFFLLCGLLPWKWFTSTLGNGSNAIVANAGLVNQVYVPKYVLPMITIMVTTMKFMVVLPILLLFLIWNDFSPTIHWLALLVLIAIQFLLISGITWILSAMVPFIPDLRYVIENGLLLLMFLSGVFFDMSGFNEDLKSILYLNPLARLLSNYRDVLLHNQWPPVTDVAYIAGFALACCLCGWYLLNKIDRRVIKVL